MLVHDLKDSQGRVFAFEVPNFVLGRSGAVAIVRSIPRVRLIRGPVRWSWFREESFCEFKVDSRRFVIWEPFGDNSRYWVGPEPPAWCEEVDVVRRAFLRARPWSARLSALYQRRRSQ